MDSTPKVIREVPLPKVRTRHQYREVTDTGLALLRVVRESHPVIAPAERTGVHSPNDVADLARTLGMDAWDQEVFAVILLDAQHRAIGNGVWEITRGTLDTSVVHPRETFRPAIVQGDASVILLHNHPSGDPTPSPEDRMITSQLCAAGTLLGIPVRDHVVIGRGRYTSFAEAGYLPQGSR